MDVMSFLKMVPAVIGIAGLLTYIMRTHYAHACAGL
jgi:hypothetical protein